MQLMGVDAYNQLNFATNSHKDIWQQIQADQNVELLAYNSDYSVRITGRVSFDVTDEAAKTLFHAKGKIVEHWDSIQKIPEQSANENTMY